MEREAPGHFNELGIVTGIPELTVTLRSAAKG
jgi:hypothetical protein